MYSVVRLVCCLVGVFCVYLASPFGRMEVDRERKVIAYESTPLLIHPTYKILFS